MSVINQYVNIGLWKGLYVYCRKGWMFAGNVVNESCIWVTCGMNMIERSRELGKSVIPIESVGDFLLVEMVVRGDVLSCKCIFLEEGVRGWFWCMCVRFEALCVFCFYKFIVQIKGRGVWDNLAEWSKALRSGRSLYWRGFESHSCHFWTHHTFLPPHLCTHRCDGVYQRFSTLRI